MCKDVAQLGNGIDIVIWEYRPNADDYAVVSSNHFVRLDCEGDKCIPFAASTLGEIVVNDGLQEDQKIADTHFIYLSHEYSRFKWKSVYATQKNGEVGSYVIGLFSKRGRAFATQPAQKSARSLAASIVISLMLIEKLDEFERRRAKFETHLFKINAADVAKQFLHDIKDHLHEVDEPLQKLKRSNKHSRREIDIASNLVDMHLNGARDLASAFMDRARNHSLRVESIKLHDLMTSTVSDFRLRAIAQGIEFEEHVSDREDYVRVDRYHFLQAFHNVLSNAFYFSAKGGSSPRVELSFNEALRPGFVGVSILDTGPGIPDIEKAFEVGFTSKKVGGTGFGLPLARDTMRKHRGEIVITTAVGSFTRVTLELPA